MRGAGEGFQRESHGYLADRWFAEMAAGEQWAAALAILDASRSKPRGPMSSCCLRAETLRRLGRDAEARQLFDSTRRSATGC